MNAGTTPFLLAVRKGDLRSVQAMLAAGADVNEKRSGDLATPLLIAIINGHVDLVDLLLDKTRAWSYGDPMDPAIDMGTVIDEEAAMSFEAKVNDALARGARLLCGNLRRGALYSPTLLDQVTPDMPVVKYETFGPVSPVIRFKDIDEAIRIANATDYGLSSAVCTNRLDYITRFVSELHVGTVNVRADGEVAVKHGDTVYLTPDKTKLHRFGADGKALAQGG